MFNHFLTRLFVSYLAIILLILLVTALFFRFGQGGGLALILVVIIGILLSLLFSFLLNRSVKRVYREITEAIQAISEGRYDKVAFFETSEEVNQIAQSLNTMMAQVEANQQAMQDFVSNASHELKTPLTSIQGFAQALHDNTADDEASRTKAAHIIYDEATRMRRLIDDLLDLARIESGQIIIGKSSVDLTAILSRSLTTLKPQADDKNVRVRSKFEALPNVVGDGDRLAQVFLNLIDNAIKHAPKDGNGSVIVQAESIVQAPFKTNYTFEAAETVTKEYVRVYIIDNGPGIAPEDLSRIFERLYQVDKSRQRGQGMGLGLTIAYNIVRVHGGELKVESQVGRGTRFTIWLPTKEADVSTLITRQQFQAKGSI